MAGVKGKSGGARANTGGARPGAGRPRKNPIKEQKSIEESSGWGGARLGAGRPKNPLTDESKKPREKKLDVWPLFKTCTCCAIEKRRDLFSVDKSRPKKIPSKCKSCANDYSKNYYKENTNKCKSSVRSWNAQNPEKKALLNKDWATRNKSDISERSKRWWNFEGGREKGKITYQKQVSLVSDGYAAGLMNLHVKDCPPELIELKREQLTIKRLSRQIKQTTKAHNETSTNIS